MKIVRLRDKILTLVIFVIAFLFFNYFQGQIKNFFYSFSMPIQKVFWQASGNVHNFFQGIFQTNQLKKENEELKLKIHELEAEITSLKEVKKENEFLRTSLNIGLQKEYKLILAEVVGGGISGDILVIDKGSKDGILKDLPVITEQKVLIGKVFQVEENYSKIMLITNKDSSFNGKILETNNENNAIEGVIKGKGNLKIIFDFLPKDREIKEGSFVVTSSLDKIFPKGILVGKIGKVKKSDLEPFQQAEIMPSFDVKELRALFVIKM